MHGRENCWLRTSANRAWNTLLCRSCICVSEPQHVFGSGEMVEDKIHGYCVDQEPAWFLEHESPSLSSNHPGVGQNSLVTELSSCFRRIFLNSFSTLPFYLNIDPSRNFSCEDLQPMKWCIIFPWYLAMLLGTVPTLCQKTEDMWNDVAGSSTVC
jgi:hypothetical protein